MTCASDQIEVKPYIPQPGEMPFGIAFEFSGRIEPGDILEAILGMLSGQMPPPPPPPPRVATMDRHESALFLATYSVIPKDYILDSTEARDRAYKIAARKLHPDAGGSHDLFVKLQQAKEALA